MTATRGAPSRFRGYIAEANANFVHVKAYIGEHEALIRRPNIRSTRMRMCVIGGKGIAERREEGWCWVPDPMEIN